MCDAIDASNIFRRIQDLEKQVSLLTEMQVYPVSTFQEMGFHDASGYAKRKSQKRGARSANFRRLKVGANAKVANDICGDLQ
jgi:hypothetical protein